jgi:hypothetical protein
MLGVRGDGTRSGVSALTAVFFRQQLVRLLEARPHFATAVTRSTQIVAGVVLVLVARKAFVMS